ncbi:hypothetical protein LE190_15685 [Massilia oculi]|uniref:Acetyl-CoA hydrolase/transferase C-terminal domain-containing protein n=1 Tax=Massilia hydrophila TaxID=3044279 RepID=A0ABS7YCC6_9BURK|nr:acetyl-CoA hydrolase/transferase C-terminal domain-containing protein [Massilia oculi]MCA1857355.1 hypothetical protein [Massilia oculi]
MPKPLTEARLHQLLTPQARVYAPGCAGHSLLFEAWLRAAPPSCAGAEYCGVWIPGVNGVDFSAVAGGSRATAFFMSPLLHPGYRAGRVDYLPLHYHAIPPYLARRGRFDLALVQVAPPDADGRCSLGVAADFTPAALASGARILAHVNPRMPRTVGPSIDWDDIDYAVEADLPLLSVEDEAPDPAMEALARVVAERIGDGATLQFGLGRLQAALLRQLTGRRQLRIHSGMVSSALLGLAESGALAAPDRTAPPVVTGVALGSDALYRRLAEPGLARFAPVAYTHANATLAALPRLVSINSALNVDLLGQVNGETLDGRQVSGVGGMLDFVRGARLSEGGMSILALPATARGGTLSRIVVSFGGLVSVGRTDVDCVVTEYGCADLRYLGVAARAQALIGIAAPQFRDGLAAQWHLLQKQL